MDRALLHCDCCYACPNTRAVGYVCRTNHASNTAFRGFGGPQVCAFNALAFVGFGYGFRILGLGCARHLPQVCAEPAGVAASLQCTTLP